MTNLLAILSLALSADHSKVTVEYYAPSAPPGSLAFFDAKRHTGDPWLKDYGVATVNPGTNTVTFRAPFPDQALLRVRVESPPSSPAIPIEGVYSAELGGHYQTGNILTPGARYSIRNNSGQTLTVMVLDVDGMTPTQYFPLLNGEGREFVGGMGLDLFTGQVGEWVCGIELRRI